MKQSRHHLAAVIGEKTLHISDTGLLAREIAAYLLDEKHTGELDSLMRDIIAYRAEHGAVEAVAASTSPLSDEVLADIKTLLEREYPKAKQVIVREKRDDSVIGGVRIDLPNEQLDLTVKSKLSTFKRLTALERNKA
jgi:F0F1-type ATP synthase delta subunit